MTRAAERQAMTILDRYRLFVAEVFASPPECVSASQDILAAVDAALASCMPRAPHLSRSFDILLRYYGLMGYGVETLAALGRGYGCTRERIRQLRNQALTAVRNPAFSAHLAAFLSETSD